MNCTPWGALPSFFRFTVTRPPVADLGALKEAVCPCSAMLRLRVVGLLELVLSESLLPQPVIANAPSRPTTTNTTRDLRTDFLHRGGTVDARVTNPAWRRRRGCPPGPPRERVGETAERNAMFIR